MGEGGCWGGVPHINTFIVVHYVEVSRSSLSESHFPASKKLCSKIPSDLEPVQGKVHDMTEDGINPFPGPLRG